MIAISVARFLRLIDQSGIDYFVTPTGGIAFVGSRKALDFIASEVAALNGAQREDARTALVARDYELRRRLVTVLGRIVV